MALTGGHKALRKRMNQRRPRLELPKLLNAAKDAPCMICGDIGTTVAAHYGSARGMGYKADDCAVAYLCHTHHDEVDGRSGGLSRPEQRELFLRAYVRTVRYWIDLGLLRT